MEGSIAFIVIGFVVLLMILSIGLLISVKRLRTKLNQFMMDRDGASLVHTFELLIEKSKHTDLALQTHKTALEMLDARVKNCIRGYSLIKYNAYGDVGGEQSFACTLINEYQDGYVLSIITNRNHTGVYAKKVEGGIAESALTPEESQSLEVAKVSLPL